jgi:hypothetical protein
MSWSGNQEIQFQVLQNRMVGSFFFLIAQNLLVAARRYLIESALLNLYAQMSQRTATSVSW